MTAEINIFDDLFWTATRYAQVLAMDVRTVNELLVTAPHALKGSRKVWHVREGMPAIFGGAGRKNPDEMEPREALDFYKAQREKIKLATETGELIPAVGVEATIGLAFKALAQSLDSLPDALERDLGLPGATVQAIQQAIDQARERLYNNLILALPEKALLE